MINQVTFWGYSDSEMKNIFINIFMNDLLRQIIYCFLGHNAGKSNCPLICDLQYNDLYIHFCKSSTTYVKDC